MGPSADPGHQVGSLTPEGQVPFPSPVLEPHKPLGMLHNRTDKVDLCRVTCGAQTPVLMHTPWEIFYIGSAPAAATLHFCDPGA